VCGQVLVALLVSGVFWDEMEVFTTDNEGSVHLGRYDGTGQDTATDGNETSEGALLVNVRTLNGGLWCAETQSNVLEPSLSCLS